VDTTVEQLDLHRWRGARGREGVLDVWLVGRVVGWGVGGVVVLPSSPRPPLRQHRGSLPGPVSGKTARRLQQHGDAGGGGEEDRVRVAAPTATLASVRIDTSRCPAPPVDYRAG
jgi:hypothetical protein